MNHLHIERLNFERDDLPLFENIDASWRAGDIIQLAGHNGSGKTTLMRLVAGLIEPTSGSIKWNDCSVQSHQFRSSLLYLGHQVGVKLTMTPLENLTWYFGLNGLKSNNQKQPLNIPQEKLTDALTAVGLENYLNVPCYQLSAGQHRRVALARMYLSEAPIWLLDEPFTAIDKSGVADLESRIETHADNGGIVVLTTHQSWNAERIKIFDVENFSNKGRS